MSEISALRFHNKTRQFLTTFLRLPVIVLSAGAITSECLSKHASRRGNVKTILAMILFAAVSAAAQDQVAVKDAQSACGAANVKYDAHQDASQHPAPLPDPDKALIYVVQEIGELKCSGCALTRVGMDGAWVGANQGSSYFFFSTEPGDHHVCLNWQSLLAGRSRAYAFANFTAEAGKTYYFRARILQGHYNYSFDLDPINSDEGKYLVAASLFSDSHPKK